MKHSFLKIFTPIIIAAGISACSVSDLAPSPKPKLDGGFTCECTVTAGMIPPGSDTGEETEFVFSGDLKRLGAGFWELEISSPETISGMKMTSCDGELSSSLGELSFDLAPEDVPQKSPVYALFTAIDNMSSAFENGAELTSGEEGGWVYTADGISAVFDGDGVITSLALASPKMTAQFTNFAETETIMETPSESETSSAPLATIPETASETTVASAIPETISSPVTTTASSETSSPETTSAETSAPQTENTTVPETTME
ncbi:MAG: hypothetical protein ACI4J0_01585 [Huintestinicola sp.]|uniref:hypothetical protein n=1 Tax=Huintestinicola sp. TaxID=2981661 RepID=UPI003F128614